MGSDFRHGVLAIELSMTSLAVDRGTDKWNSLCKGVREACENYGCFEIVYDKIPLQLRAEAFSLIKQLFSLPLETKKKNVNPKSFHGYCGEYPHVRFNTIVTMMRQLDEQKDMIEMMILDSYGLGEK
ncbi:PREDICTED: probable [Prunus dulcis]|uniref:PREDICTED: probable n=1 Tax=Prunus dulcis TaxID=3755 RepID=A0A5E4EGW0_PRUDU|nr:PREDICTED: probable [Prunus dulcis]